MSKRNLKGNVAVYEGLFLELARESSNFNNFLQQTRGKNYF